MWPLVNFVGFAWIPYKLQPTFMSIAQFFWQIYISSMASNEVSNESPDSESKSFNRYVYGLSLVLLQDQDVDTSEAI